MPRSRVAVVTDSAAAIPHALQARYALTVIPLRVAIGANVYLEGVNISPPKVVAALVAGEHVRPFEPPLADFVETYRRCAELGADQVVSIHLSSKLHRMHDLAVDAAATSPIPVIPIDTHSVSMAEGFAVLAAAAVAAAGGTGADCAEAAIRVDRTSRLMMTVETLDYVHRDGRVPTALKYFANATKMRPILELKDGEIALSDRARNTGPARERLRALMSDYARTLSRPAVAVSIVGGGAAEEGLMLDDLPSCIEVSPGASLSAHTGPGTFAIAAADMPIEYAF